MAEQLEREIKESILNDKILNIYKKFKYYFLALCLIIFVVVVSYQIKNILDKKKFANELYLYSIALKNLDQNNFNEASNILRKLVNSKNSVISTLSINRLIDNNKINTANKIKLIDEMLSKKKLTFEFQELLKIKKSLIIFIEASENDILSLINTDNQDLFLKNIKKSLLHDFYITKNNFDKALEIKNR